MNNEARNYLIEIAKQNKTVTYSEIVRDCKLGFDLSTDYGKGQLGEVLGKVSEFEYKNNRPMISALVIYKDTSKGSYGEGFYRLAEQLGIGKIKNLKADYFGEMEMARCFEFWKNPENVALYSEISAQSPNTPIASLFKKLINLPNYKWVEEDWVYSYLEFVKEIQTLRKSINDNPAIPIDDELLYTNLSDQTRSYEAFMRKFIKVNNSISTRGQSVISDRNFELLLRTDDFKFLIRNVIIDPSLDSYNRLNSWWFGNQNIGNNPLLINRCFAACNPENLSSTVSNKKFWDAIHILESNYQFSLKKEHQWNWFNANCQLVEWLDGQLSLVLNEVSKDTLEQKIWRNVFVWLVYDHFQTRERGIPDQLIQREVPKGSTQNMDEREPSFSEVDIDFVGKAIEQKNLGDLGEELVKCFEVKALNEREQYDKAKLVEIVKDGRGFDVLSFDENGNEKHIEVKTTEGGKYTKFYLSRNEVDFMRKYPSSYSLYRVYNYDIELNSGEFYELKGDVEEQLNLEPIQFEVRLKSR